ncbi:Pre-mRNA splicing factor PRP21 like protein-domain-containing protein [Talaromyces proteolyticus]|uniref:Pre-mRNA splicing factor PRP21 like protein-domain-containing protein n=1 Tax=Talaromyces proteolyticus TaxID=1131652 RepID=A0AAD4Q5A2_9EURO|nr:Pre-mRNA splicing factor PRP21 like protein-domain-containing protein [Talaromyces proteolyticus]KAH8703820.1 Pre-mRNA splicing factor PRP21 like protein-domain-containing protein [Talaromyces proteolyticus]
MAAVETNGNGVPTPTSTPTLQDEGSSKPPGGVVVPPKDIRAIVEKTAGYVARNGPIFEQRIREKEKSNPKFSFLSTGDAYEAFYLWRLNEIKEGRGTDVSAGRPGEAPATPAPETPQGPAAPPDFHFSARMPIINAQDLEVVKLTALFVAKRGKLFMTSLSQREARNYQFDFLRPQHSLYQFFTRLVDQYTILLSQEGVDSNTTEKKRLAELDRNVKDKRHVLDRAKKRAEWVKFQEKQKQRKEEEEEEDRIAYAQIDWHDFAVVETVLFTEDDDQIELPPPASLGDLQSASLEQKAMMSLNPLRIEEAMPTDEMEPVYYNAYPVEQAGPIQPPDFEHQPTAPPPPFLDQHIPPQALPQYQPVSTTATEEEQRIRERTEARDQASAAQAAAKGQPTSMRIRSDYVPRAQTRRQNAAATALCPNCGQQIPVAELDHHMRIELLDPRWKEQRAKADSRAATTNLSTVDVVNNLKRLASQRSDVFDSTNNPSATPSAAATGSFGPEDPEEEARRKRMAFAPPGAAGVPPGQGYEGAPSGFSQMPTVGPGPAGRAQNPQTMNLQEQIRNLHEKYGQKPPGS